jgi:hypothetical protein
MRHAAIRATLVTGVAVLLLGGLNSDFLDGKSGTDTCVSPKNAPGCNN